MKFCRRCMRHREDYLFQEPVAMCMLCYAMLARNADIATNLNALRDKARRSRYGRRLRAEENRLLLRKAIDANARKDLDAGLRPSASANADEILSSCDGPCRRLLPYDSLTPDSRSITHAEYAPMLCAACTDLRSSLPTGTFMERFYLKGEFWGHEETEEETLWKAEHFAKQGG